ncbi:MAG: Ig-like domain-containing protein [Gemmatimonadales bacterium]
MTFMHKLSRRLAGLPTAAAAAAVIIGACEQPAPPTSSQEQVAQLIISPKAIVVQPNQDVTLISVGLTPHGDTAQIDVAWSTSGGDLTDLGVTGGRHYARYRNASSGTFKVWATAQPGGKSDTASITVAPPSPEPVASVDVTPPSASVLEGQTVQLTAMPRDANGNPLSGRAVTWASGNPAVATVSASGLVTGVAAGSATITATSEGQNGTSLITVTTLPPPGTGVVFVGAGDISSCSQSNDEATASLLDGIAGTVFTAGDNVYPDGTDSQFAQCYEPTWGRHKARARPSPGNHDYHTAGAAGYYAYFGANAGPSGRGYYSYDLGEWHLVSLNSNISMSAGSGQEQWLRADLAASTKRCTLAYWHHPRFSSGSHGSSTASQPLWQALYDHDADVIIVGHDHNYQRFAPQTPSGAADPARGIRQFVAGMGGQSHYNFGTPIANTEAYNTTTYGVLKLTLSADSYAWEFVPVAGGTYTDSGSAACH